MKATARPSPSAITQALVPYPPRDRPSASRVSRSADEPPFERHRLLSGGPGCWCRPETSSRAGHHAPGPGAAAAPTRPGAPSGGRSAPPATRDQAQPGRRATWPRSDAARRWPTACAAGPEAGSCPWAGIPRSAAPASSSVRLSAWPLLPSQEEQNARKPIQFKREQALVRLAKLDDLFQHLHVEALALGLREDLLLLLVDLLQLGVELLDALHERTDALARDPNRVGHGVSFIEPGPHHPISA